MDSGSRLWISALAGPILLAAAVRAQDSSDAEIPTLTVVAVAGVVGVVLVSSVLALCGSSSKSHAPVRHEAVPAVRPAPSSNRPASQAPARKPIYNMSEMSVQIDMAKAQHQQGKPLPYAQVPANGTANPPRPGPGHVAYSGQVNDRPGHHGAPGHYNAPAGHYGHGVGHYAPQIRPPSSGGGMPQPGYHGQQAPAQQWQQQQQPPPPSWQHPQQQQPPGHYQSGPSTGRPVYQQQYRPESSSVPQSGPQGAGRATYPSSQSSVGRPDHMDSFGSAVDPRERASMPQPDSFNRPSSGHMAPQISSAGRADVYAVSGPPAQQQRPANPTGSDRPRVSAASQQPWAPMQNPQAVPQQYPSPGAQVPSIGSGVRTTAAPRPSPTPPAAPTGPVLAPKDGSLDALVDFIQEIVVKTNGRCGSGPYTIDGEQPIRKCLYSVQCTCKTNFGKSVDALFFAARTDYDRQHLICGKRPLQEFRADVREVVDASTFRDSASGLTVAVPNFIITEATLSMDDIIANMTTVQKNSTISAIATQLATQLVMLHSKKIVHCGITRRNIVQLGGMNAIWTFREYCCYVGEGKEMEAARHLQETRMLPPEVRPNVCVLVKHLLPSGKTLILNTFRPSATNVNHRNATKAAEAAMKQVPMIASAAMDIWQLGVLLYELYSGSTYWPAETSAQDVLTALATPGSMPHEADPAMLNAIVRGVPTLQPQRAIITRMLDRIPANRPTAASLKRDLIASASDTTMQGNTVTSWQPSVINIGSAMK